MTADALQTGRAHWLDAARGGAVVAMVIYHFAWDLSHFGVIDVDVALHPGWRAFAKAIAASFLALAGYALVLAHGGGIRWPAFGKRLGVIAGAALVVTLGSWFAFPASFIFFGILHCIAVSSVLALVFLRLPWWLTALVAMLVWIAPDIYRSAAFNGPALVWTGLGTRVPFTNDFEPIFPWLGYLLGGVAIAKLAPPTRLPFGPVRSPALEWLGRWSLPIYLIHQPVLFGLTLGAFRMGWI